ncbi:MAG TPA: sigma-70 family RNA polymerase sigma factor [Pyrinomonadaceae bacterium]|nr:sigma-70 family RNA polymerase sigma factor [Pyrinomonadaceae bacterium]
MQAALKTLQLVNNDPVGVNSKPVNSGSSVARTESVGELETLFQAHHGRVFRTAQRITGSAADAEDVLQNVFLRLVKGQDDYDLSRNPEAYLSRAAINASLDLLRSRSRSKVVGLDDVNTEALTSGFRNPEVTHADRELQTLVRQAVSRLGKTAGEMFVLRYYEGFDNKEIAVLLNTSPLVVGVVLHRARTKLRKEIGHYLEKHHEE